VTATGDESNTRHAPVAPAGGDHDETITMGELEVRLRRLSINDTRYLDACLRSDAAEDVDHDLDPHIRGLLRLGLLVALDGPPSAFEWATSEALASGATRASPARSATIWTAISSDSSSDRPDATGRAARSIATNVVHPDRVMSVSPDAAHYAGITPTIQGDG
jgi:hypothetical protein